MFDENIVKTGSNEMELVDFRIFKQGHDKVYEGIYGVNVSKVREIIKSQALQNFQVYLITSKVSLIFVEWLYL